MKIKIYEDRSYSRENFSNEGTENENLATTLYFQFPETVNGVQTSTLNKYIVFDINGEPNTDILTSNNSYSIPTAITQLGTVSFNIYLVAPTNNGEDSPFRWISKKITLNFNDANDMTEIVITVEEINIFNSLLSELNSAIANVELLEQFEQLNQNYQAAISQVENVNIDVSKAGTIATVTITNKEGIQKSVEILDGDDYILTEEDKQEIINTVEAEVSLDIPTKVSQLENDSAYINKEVNNLTNYYKKDETYTKEEVDNKVASVYKYKGTVATYADLPSLNLTIGDVYNVESDGSNYAWDGTAWDKLGGDIDLSGYQEKIDNSHKLSADLVDDTSTTHKFTSTSEKSTWNAKYDKPSGGIPSTDMSSSVQTSLEKAETAIQDVSGKEDKSNKTGILDENSTDTQYPHAKAVYDNFVTRDEEIEKLQTENAQLLADHPDILDENDEFPSGTDLTLNGTGDLKMKVDVGGNSTQVQYEGYQLFDKDNYLYYNGYFIGLGTSTIVSESANKIIYIPCSSNTQYTASKIISKRFGIGYTTEIPNANVSVYNVDSNNSGTSISITTGDNAEYLVVYIRNGNISGEETLDNIINSLQIIEGSTSKPYEPYTDNLAVPNPNQESPINNVEGNVVVNSLRSNNFLNPEKVVQDNNSSNIYITDDKQYIRFLTNAERMKIIPTNIQEKTAYTYKLIFKNGSDGLNQFVLNANYTDGTVEQLNTVQNVGTNSTKTYIVTTNEEKTLINIGMGHSVSKEAFLQIEGSMIAKGAYTEQTLHEYREYAENKVTFPLSQEQKLMLGDTLEDDGVHHKRAKVTANELKTVTTYINPLTDFVRISFMISDLTNKVANEIPSGLCNYLKFLYDYNNESNHFYARGNVIYVFLEKTLLSSLNVTGVRAFLDEHPDLEIEYKLATETITPYTSAQQTAYNKLKEMQSYYDLTYVTGSSDNAQPILTAHAKKSLKVMNDEISNLINRVTILED